MTMGDHAYTYPRPRRPGTDSEGDNVQDYRIEYVIVDGQNGRVGDGSCKLPLTADPPSLDWLSDELTAQLREQGWLVGSCRARATSYRLAVGADR
jgi:hypothetical protein